MSVSVSVKRQTLEEIQSLLKDIKHQEKNSSIGTIGISKTIPCRVSKEKLNSILEKINNLLG